MKRLIIILTLIPTLAMSQDMTIRNVILSIPDGIPVKVDRSITNTGTVINHGKLIVGRNWINTGNYSDGTTGLLDLNGNAKQFIADSRGTIGSIRMAGGEKEIITDLSITRSFEMSKAKVFVSDGYRLLLAQEATLDYEDGDRIIGDLYMTGNDLTFPVGTMERSLPVRVHFPDDQILELGLSARNGLIGPAMERDLAEIADFHWLLKCPQEFKGASFEIGFENADFLQQMELATVAFAVGATDSIRNGGNRNFTGSINKGTVSSLSVINGPYLTLARRYSDNEKPPVNVLNLITPNSDGINDFLLIENIESYPNNRVSVFDRWGNKVYEGNGYNNGDIRFEGVANRSLNKGDMDSGTYFFLISYGGETLMNGFFELIR